MRWFVTTILGSVLGLVIYVILCTPQTADSMPAEVKLGAILPETNGLVGWKKTTRRLAESPDGDSQVKAALNFDWAASVDYSNGSTRISIYMAYWSSGKVPCRIVAGHTPDICWINNGWTCAVSRAEQLRLETGELLQPAQYRAMRLNQHDEQVLFWHVVAGRAISYGNGLPPWYAFITDIGARGFNQRAEQYFVRVSTDSKDHTWLKTEIMQRFFRNAAILHAATLH